VNSLQLVHTSGAVELRDVEVRIVDGTFQLRGLVDPATWERLQRHDIFGSAGRMRSPGSLVPGHDVRITVATDQTLPVEVDALPSDRFVILDATQRIDPADLRAEGLEGDVWIGISFGEPAP